MISRTKRLERVHQSLVRGNDDESYFNFLNHRDECAIVPVGTLRTLWSITKTLTENGGYAGDAIFRGYAVLVSRTRSPAFPRNRGPLVTA